MQVRKLAVEGALEFTPKVFADDRGLFTSPYQEPAFVEAVGRPLFSVAQTNHSRSRRGVVRGVHFSATPPGAAKYVYCARGQALDIVVDLRLGSPTFGKWDASVLDPEHFRAMYMPIGVGHAFVALEDDTVMSYLLSESYVPNVELEVSLLDATLGLPIPEDITPIMSARDLAAPTVAEAEAKGLLPKYSDCQQIEAH